MKKCKTLSVLFISIFIFCQCDTEQTTEKISAASVTAGVTSLIKPHDAEAASIENGDISPGMSRDVLIVTVKEIFQNFLLL